MTMETDRKWIVVRIDGKLAGISQDYGRLAEISVQIDKEYRILKGGIGAGSRKKSKGTGLGNGLPYDEITAKAVSFEEILMLKESARWEDLMLLGSDFQKRVWKALWDLKTHARLLSYTDFADLCDNRAGVRAVAHAVGLNPLPILIPCHLVVPKEAIDRIREIQLKAESTIFKGEDLCRTAILNDNSIDFGEYALGRDLKRRLISLDIENQPPDA